MSEQKIKRFVRDLGNALERLGEALHISVDENPLALDATIQRFEFSFELFWKTLRVMLQQEGIEAASPRQVIKEAYAVGWLDNEEAWLTMLEARNLSAHVYNEELAEEIYRNVKATAPIMQEEYLRLLERSL
jgi:nucleotidyltransferase substrate binding protein (TIGR01987 family)